MSITFKVSLQGEPDKDTIALTNFVIINKHLLKTLFAIVSSVKKPSIDEVKIKRIARLLHTHNDPEIGRFIELVTQFYNCHKDVLSRRRGALLELIVQCCKPINYDPIIKSCFDLYREALVFHNGIITSPKKIDVIFDYEEIDAIECKATIVNWLNRNSPPLPPEVYDKLQFMNSLIASAYPVIWRPLLATYSNNVNFEQHILNRSGFPNIQILTGNQISSLVI